MGLLGMMRVDVMLGSRTPSMWLFDQDFPRSYRAIPAGPPNGAIGDNMTTYLTSKQSALGNYVFAQCSATPATVAATPPCSATPFQTPKFRCDTSRHMGGGRCDTKIFRGCSATPVLHLQNAIKSRKSAATRVARHV